MASVHRTTMTPTKLDLLTRWLPSRSWYAGGAEKPELVKAGGFRLDDPEGEVGIEFMVVVDTGPADPVTYLVPMGYRGTPREGAAEETLIGTSEHGVLGTRWIYDGAHDPVVTARLHALLRGEATPQHQSESDTPDPTVTVRGTAPGYAHGTGPALDVDLVRVLRPEEEAPSPSWCLVAGWTRPDGTSVRGVFATAAPRHGAVPRG
ncbi:MULTISPECIES: 1,4-alpha-glucan branching protein [unclassified Streptomyces]|uniref:maltokinase N-terminal cap-like domain-containing protein n=1 Tax=unclassified Streptomyces TaxID=2593676 RepID=UPI0034430E5D